MFYIIIFILGFIIGCIAYHEAISVEIRECKTSKELAELLEKLRLVDSKNNEKQ